MKKHSYKKLSIFMLSILFFCVVTKAQQYTENFVSAPTLIDYPGYPAWKEIAEVTLGGVVYQIDNGGNGSWSLVNSGGVSNSSCLTYSTAADVVINIRRKDGLKFAFYGAWVKYTNYNIYPAPYLSTSYSSTTYGINSTVTLSTPAVVGTSVSINFSGLNTLYFDDLIVGPPPPEVPTISTNSINLFDNAAATLGGNVSADGGATVTERGIVYNTSASPTISNSKVVIGNGTGTFTSAVSGLNSNTLYYVRAFATNSVGTAYGAERTFTTASPFTLAQTHYFNTAWVSTSSQATPFTKYVEGWNVTASSTNAGLVSISRITATGVNSPGEGIASLRAQSATSSEELAWVGFKTSTAQSFDLQSFKFRYLTKTVNTYFNTITVTGYKNGSPVSGAVQTISNIAQTTGASYGYTTFDLSANNNFNNIDEFRISASNSPNSARLNIIDVDVLTVQDPPVVLAVNSLIFTGHQINHTVSLDWSFKEGKDLSHFNIQRSSDAVNFEPIGNVEVHSNSVMNFSFTDIAPLTGMNYYRLKTIDLNGQYRYSDVIKVLSKENIKRDIVYPNPVTNNKLFIRSLDQSARRTGYVIYNDGGKVVLRGSVASQEQPVYTTGLIKGVYYIKLSNDLSTSFIKE